MTEAPTLTDLQALAERALEHAEGDAQATAVWESGRGLTIDVTCVIDGRAARAQAASSSGDALRRAARAAALHARRARAWPSAGLPEPAPAHRHDDAGSQPPAEPAPPLPELRGVRLTLTTGAARVAIASTRGVRAAEQRSYAIAEATAGAAGRAIRLRAAATTTRALPVEELAREAQALRRDERVPGALPSQELPVVLGPDAVATVLDHLRPAFGVELDLGSGPLHGRFGTRVAAAAVNLADSPRHPATLRRGFDAEGVPRRPVPLIQDGVAHRRVHDTASAAAAGTRSTGHATRAAALAPLPEHLVLTGGGAAGVQELWAPVARGLYVPALSPARESVGDAYRHTAHGAVLIEDGKAAAPVADGTLLVDPPAILASVEALTAWTRTLPLAAHAPGGPGAAVVPAIRAAAGCRPAS